MSKRKGLYAKAMAAAMTTSMMVGMCPISVLAVSGDQVAKDGTYTADAHVVNDPKYYSEWDEYGVNVKLTVEDGKFSGVTVTADRELDVLNSAYFSIAAKSAEAALKGKDATADTIQNWDVKSSATCTTTAAKTAALEAIAAAEGVGNTDDDAELDVAELEAAIRAAKEKQEADYTAESWSAMQDKLKEAEAVLAKPESAEAVKKAADALAEATKNLALKETEKDPVEEAQYVLMNIPYADFYAAEVENDVPVDAFTSATLNKTRTAGLAGGSYHTKSDGSEITGITFPVKVGEGVDLSAYKEVTDTDKVEITVTNRGQTTTTVYEGKDALFENESYAYYVLDAAPSYYKELTAEDGGLSFGKTVGERKTVDGAKAVLSTESSYGDYQLNLSGLTFSTDTVYAVILSTKEGADYGLRHLENVWRGSQLAWCTGFTDAVHNCPTSSAHYEKMMGQTIKKITYFTADGIYEIPADVYVPKKFEYKLEVADAAVSAGSAALTAEGLPSDFVAEYAVEGLDIEVEDGVLSYKDAEKGQYTLTVSDKSGQYAPISTSFELYADVMPAKYDADQKQVVRNEGAGQEELDDFLKEITTVSVNGKSYAASGRGATVLVNADGTLAVDADPIKEDGFYQIVVHATGYQELKFTYIVGEVYALMNIPYGEFYAEEVNNAEPVDAFTSATLNKTRTASLVGGSYHEKSDGSEITGITFPVKLDGGVDLAEYRQITDEDEVEITVTNRGQTTTTVYEGKDVLFENESYAYYVLDAAPAYYKELTAEDGGLSFGKTVGERKTVDGAKAVLSTESSYGDYQLNLSGLTFSTDTVYAVILSTEEGDDYGLRHMENIWIGTQLAWCTGFTDAVHNCPTSSAHYEKMMGQTIEKITYFTADGIYEIPVKVYVPEKFDYTFEVADASIDAGQTEITLKGLPEDFEAEYAVENLENAKVEGNVLSYQNAEKGKYTLTVTDGSGKYAPLICDFELYTEDMPAKFNEDSKAPALVPADGFGDAELADFLKNITTVSVDGKDYPAVGRGSVTIINEDGTLQKDAAPIAEKGDHELVVTATGYQKLTFVYSAGAEDEDNKPGEDDNNNTGDNNTGNNNTGNNNTGNNNTGNKDNTNNKNQSTGAGNTKNPQTGDPANMLGWMAMALASAGAGGFALKKKSKNRRTRR